MPCRGFEVQKRTVFVRLLVANVLRMCRLSSFVVFALGSWWLGAVSVAGEEPTAVRTRSIPSADVDAIRRMMTLAVERGGISGAVVHVAQHGHPLLFEAFGEADINRPMTTDTIFRIASMTKALTSVAVMMLVEDGKIGLDDPLARYIPEFGDVSVVGREPGETAKLLRPITIRDLLSHVSGIAYGLNPPEPLKGAFRDAELADGLNRRDSSLLENMRSLARIPLAHQPGTAFTYGMNTDVLGRVIEVASGKPFDQFLAERIFVPLELSDTAFSVPQPKQIRLAAIYRPVPQANPARVEKVNADPETVGDVVYSASRVMTPPKYLSGGAGLVSTAADYARFLAMLQRGGELDGHRLLREDSVRTMTTNQIGSLTCAFPIHGDKFGLGFGLTTQPGGVASVGSYSWGGLYHTFFWIDPEKEIVAVLMTQLFPWGDSTLWGDFEKSVYEAIKEPANAPLATNKEFLAQRQAAMNSPGDAEQGRKLFASESLKCAVCHKVDGKGGDAGPDLSLVAGKFDRAHLIEAIHEPSAQILEGYRTTTVLLKDGRSFSGIAVSPTKEGFTLVDASNKRTLLVNSEIEERSTSAVSLMPANLVAGLSPSEFTDLIAYLETLRAGRRSNPGEGIIATLTLPEGFYAQQVAGRLSGSTAMEVAPDGRIFICEQTGALRVVKDGQLLAEPFVKLNVASTWERGLLGVTVDPEFPRKPYVYVCYVSKTPTWHHVVSRLTADGDRSVAGSELILFEGDDQAKLGGNVPDGHQGGALHFGRDGKLYVAIGDQTAGQPSQNLDSLLGKMLRINPNGSIPDDNPFYLKTQGKYRAIWALGLRNPYTFAVHPRTGRMLINDVGGKSEEINDGLAGANYGWPATEHGPTADPRFRGPIHHYPEASIAGGVFAPDDLNWPTQYRGRYFYADFKHGALRTLDPEHPSEFQQFAGGLRGPVDLRFGPDGTLYVLLRNAWVIDNAFQSDTGALVAIRQGKPSSVTVSEETLFGDMECLVINTMTAKYYYGKRGAGFAKIIDPDGHDWISYRHGGQAAGEYRGLPKAGQPVKYFHCGYGFGQYANDNPFHTSFTQVSAEHVHVESQTKDGAAVCAWDFFPGYATLTLKRIPGDRYWFLYEGTPGGGFDVTDDYSIRPKGKRSALSEAWSEVVPWAAFDAKESPFALVCVNHQRNSPGDSYVRWPYNRDAQGIENQMTVFGFGRPDWRSSDQHTPQLVGLPARFTIAITKPNAVATVAEKVIDTSELKDQSVVGKGEFQSLFDGQTLGKWDGDPKFWRVENGAIVGETTTEKQPVDGKNTFLIYRGREFADFELRFRYKVQGFNSGMQYRSIDRGQFHVDGMQADFEDRWYADSPGGETRDRFSGMVFEENGRMFLAQRGEAVIVRSNPDDPMKPRIEKLGQLGNADELERVIRRDDWNDYTIIANGRVFTHIINGRVQTVAIDDDSFNFRRTGILALQLHSGKPMKIEVRDLRLLELQNREP